MLFVGHEQPFEGAAHFLDLRTILQTKHASIESLGNDRRVRVCACESVRADAMVCGKRKDKMQADGKGHAIGTRLYDDGQPADADKAPQQDQQDVARRAEERRADWADDLGNSAKERMGDSTRTKKIGGQKTKEMNMLQR